MNRHWTMHKDCYFIGRVTFATPTTMPSPKIPKEYQSHHKVFSEEQSQWLPSHSIWDHAIELLPGAPNSLPGWLLPLNLEEKAKIHKFVQEHLAWGMIHHISKSPYAANFFFIKKKDGKLQPMQDYWPLNKWTKKNKNVSPLSQRYIYTLYGLHVYISP